MEVPSISGSSKRARAPGNMSQVAHCLVDGCNADLSLCRDYHRRHKVCETHSKTPKVTIGGREQRFCQQCSRFHSLVEFDEGKRSCRKRLDGHNRRRRKPQPDSLSRSSSSGFVFSTQQPSPVPAGSRLVSFTSTPQLLPSAVVSSPSSSSSSWAAGVIKSENNNDMLLYNNHQKQLNYIDTQNSFPEHHSYKGVVVNQLHCQEMYSDGLNQVVDSDRALSLLSSATATATATPPVTREFGLNHPLAHHNMHFCGLGHNPFAQESNKPLVSAVDPHVNDATAPQYPEMFQHVPQGSSTGGPHQTLTFMWE